MSIIDDLSRMLDDLNEECLTVHEERCIGIRNRHADCLRCVEACAGGAISYEDNRLSVDVEKCIGCGSCATACPTSAIEIHSPSDGELIHGLKRSIRNTQGHPVIACTTMLDRLSEAGGSGVDMDRVLEVPCLGRVDETIVLMAAAFGCRSLSLVHGPCESCQHANGGALSERVCASAQNLLSAFGNEMKLKSSEKFPASVRADAQGRSVSAAEMGRARREFLGQSAKRGAATAVDVAAHHVGIAVDDEDSRGANASGEPAPVAYRKVNRDGTLSHCLPTRRTMMYNCLKHIGEPVAAEVDQRIIGSVRIDPEKCSSCRMCTVFCPTGALMKIDEEGAWGVAHRASACVQCRLCEHICPEQALHVESTVPTGQFMGEKLVFWRMKQPEWEANRPTSMFDKVHHVIGDELEMTVF